MKFKTRISILIAFFAAGSGLLAATSARFATVAGHISIGETAWPPQAAAQNPSASRQTQAPADAAAAAGKPQMVEDVFKNVRVLRGITVDDFMGTMGAMAAALSLCCDSCHDGAGTDKVNWASDSNPRKVRARGMVQMTQTINRNFGGRQMVTCWTCHRGRDIPTVTPDIEHDVYGEPRSDADDIFRASFPGEPSSAEIFDKYLQAVGGTTQLATLTSISATGTAVGFGRLGGEGVVHYYAQSPNKRATIVSFPKDPSRENETRTFDGTTGWISVPHSVVEQYQVSGGELDGARLDAQMAFPLQIPKLLTDVKVGPPEIINDRPVKVVQGLGERGLVAKLFFDAENGLLVRVVRMAPSPIGRVPVQIDYSNYKSVDGIRLPHSWTFAWLDGRTTMNFSDVRINVPVDSAVFSRPAQLRK
jgi:photosynthetic reaction center cytochrome c subunit